LGKKRADFCGKRKGGGPKRGGGGKISSSAPKEKRLEAPFIGGLKKPCPHKKAQGPVSGETPKSSGKPGGKKTGQAKEEKKNFTVHFKVKKNG